MNLQVKNKQIYIIILNWNNKKDTLETIESLKKSIYTNYKIIVVDNDSTDDSVNSIKKNYPEVTLIENKENLGYAEGNNIGIRYVLGQQPDYIFILNNDIAIAPEALSFLVEEGEKDKNIGILGTKIYFYFEKNIIQSAGGILDCKFNPLHIGYKEFDKGQFDNVKKIDYVSGCAMLIKKEVFEKVDMFDANFFMYWEETDLCFRAIKTGFKISIVPQAKIWHKGGVDSNPLITYYMTRNKLFFLQKHKLGKLNIFKTYISALRTILSWTIKSKWKNKIKERDMLIKALFDFSFGKTGKGHI